MSKEAIMDVDIETYDPNLTTHGAGAIRNDGRIICVGVHAPDIGVSKVFRPDDKELIDLLATDTTKVFHNGVYDLDWLVNNKHYKIGGRWEDTLTRETLLDTYRTHYNLDACCYAHGIQGKQNIEMKEWCATNGLRGDPRKHLDRMPWEMVAKYCLYDCEAGYNLYHKQQDMLDEQCLGEANRLESKLLPVLIQMKGNGVRFDSKGRGELQDKAEAEVDACYRQLNSYAGGARINSITKPSQLRILFAACDIPFVYTDDNHKRLDKPTFAEPMIKNIDHPMVKLLLHTMHIQKSLHTFIEGFADFVHRGRIHATIYPTKRDEGGTITGRTSSQKPNLQQVPSREEKYGHELRALFLPEEDCFMGSFDYKQVEYYTFTHFALGPGSDTARQKLWSDKKVDYHKMVCEMMGWDTENKDVRHIAKCVNFGTLYGMGLNSFCFKYCKGDMAYAQQIWNQLAQKAPYINYTCKRIRDRCVQRGYVVTPLGRRQREPATGLYRIVNYLVQGTAAEIYKKGLTDAADAGLFNVLRLHLPVHDETVFSIPKTREGFEAAEELGRCMVNAIKLSVPIRVDKEIGDNWFDCHEDTYLSMYKKYTGKEAD